MTLLESIRRIIFPDNNSPRPRDGVDHYCYGEPYAHLNHVDIHRKLKTAVSAEYILSCFRDFNNPDDGYKYNLPWMKAKWDKLQLATASAYFSDLQTFNECFSAIQAYPAKIDQLILNLLRYRERTEISDIIFMCFRRPDYYFGKSIYPSSKLDAIFYPADRDTLSFLKEHGVHLDAEGVQTEKHIDYSHWSTNELSTRLSRAIQKNDIQLVEYLLSCGADPNATLSITFQRASNASMKAHHLILDIENPAIFRLLMNYGMKTYPQIGYPNQKPLKENVLNDVLRKGRASQELIDVLCEYHISAYDLSLHPYFVDRNIRDSAKNLSVFDSWKARLKQLYRDPIPNVGTTYKVGPASTIETLSKCLDDDPTNRNALYYMGKHMLQLCNANPLKELSNETYKVLATLREYAHDDEYNDLEDMLSVARNHYQQFHDNIP